jgi:hypothetical protein
MFQRLREQVKRIGQPKQPPAPELAAEPRP